MVSCNGCGEALGFRKYKFNKMFRIGGRYCKPCMVKVGEKSGQLEEVLFYLSEFYEDEVDDAVKSLTAVIEPVLLIVIGLFVAFLSLAIMTPIYQITGGINL